MYIYFFVFLLIFGYSSEPIASYCDYISGSTTNSNASNYYKYKTGNDQNICNERMLRSLKVLNANYAQGGIQFYIHEDYPEMLHATDLGFDGFYENATGGSFSGPSADAIKKHYNIPNALNIYIVDFVNTRDGTSGISTYPWSDAELGTFFKHGFLPGDSDGREAAEYDRTLMHEIGHYFGLLHTNGIWYLKENNRKRDLVNNYDCNYNGDAICDTPSEPGMSNGAWHTSSRECIYHGYMGNYNVLDSTLKIGGYKYSYHNGYYPFYNYCDEWKIESPYDLGFFIMGIDTSESPIPPSCGNLLKLNLDRNPINLSEIVFFDKSGKIISMENFVGSEIIDGCNLPDMNLFLTEDGNILYNSSKFISHFQFNINGAIINSIEGGRAKENQFQFYLNHCQQFTNYDNEGKFFGTLNINSKECINNNQSDYATECHIKNYSSLPIGYNFMRAGSYPYNLCGFSPLDDNAYYDKTKTGFTEEQFYNMRYFIKNCYTGCIDPNACNFDITSKHLLNTGLSSCKYPVNGECEIIDDCLKPSDQISRNNKQYLLNLNKNKLFDNNIDCASDEISKQMTKEFWINLSKIRKKVKNSIDNKLNKNILDTLFIPIVFHNLYKWSGLSTNLVKSPTKISINKVYPNPFNPIITIEYMIPNNIFVNISIYNVYGQLITNLVNNFQNTGYYSILWDASIYSSGIYFINITANKINKTKKIVLIK